MFEILTLHNFDIRQILKNNKFNHCRWHK